ncbi:hypothetical protein DL93DRAFT_583917 [Clavulina sp. PMI_390]|nr:hypothetical protein DL93DRAFT_583917 [Clavulina sp. PMI_390]
MAWTRHNPPRVHSKPGSSAHQRSGLTSDLLPSRNPPSKAAKNVGSSQPATALPKSKEVHRLENLLTAAETPDWSPKHPKEGCFCRARRHHVSRYISLCTHCGLVLCELQHPALPCPSCRSSLFLQPAARPAVIAKITSDLQAVLKSEADARERELAEQRDREIAAAGGGAFPVLQASAGSGASHQPSQPHKVLSLNSKTKKVMVSTTVTRTVTPPPSGPSAAERAVEEAELEDVVPLQTRQTRVGPPKVMTEHAERAGTERRWEPVRGGGAMYVQPPGQPKSGAASGGGKGRKRGKDNKDSQATTSI